MAASDNEKSRLDEAARAGWLYFIAGHTQDEIAKMLRFRAPRRSAWFHCASPSA
jgi:DNA-binding transcriptional regulator LsrR (DeoR family)